MSEIWVTVYYRHELEATWFMSEREYTNIESTLIELSKKDRKFQFIINRHEEIKKIQQGLLSRLINSIMN